MKQVLITNNKEEWLNTIPFCFSSIRPAVFETFSVYAGMIQHLDLHIERLDQSLLVRQIEVDIDSKTLKSQIQTLIQQYDTMQNLKIRIQASARGYSITGEVLVDWPQEYYEEGIEIIDAVFERPTPKAKYSTPIYQYFLNQVKNKEVQEIIFFNKDGLLREGNITNVFAVFGEVIRTPGQNILEGIMRQQVLKHPDLKIIESPITRIQLQQADEIFLTNTVKGIISIQKWNTWESQSMEQSKRIRKIFDKKMN